MLALAAVLAGPAVLTLAAAPGARAAAGGWSLAPAGGGRPSVYAEGTPGIVLQDTVSVTNRGTGPLAVRLRGTGGLRITFARIAVRVPARTRADIPFTLAVPADAAPGDRAGAIAARDAHGHEATVRVRLRVGGPELSALTVERVAVRGDRIAYELVNRGTTVLVPTLAVHADGVFGTVLDRAPRTLPVRLAPGSRTELSEPWPGRPALDAVRVRLTVTAPGAARATAGASARFVPWGTVAGASGATALAAGAVVMAVRRRDRPGPDRPAGRDGTEPPSAGPELTEMDTATGAVS
ncbi:hypothetical protein WN71_032345 [Streptomyces mangrovisoli]|uniref:DUF916 domain-containing protein n=1 Tax=Streptomyces mangrovisoli TaxID=1428628 RepID=A0A1J4NND5_9ACTN|nr:hypothetical protein WN71_032345 [Streptomyces mangrovisoli]